VDGDAYETTRAVMRAVHGVMTYTPGATTVKTTAEESLAAGRGVCQDFAHLMIAACRALGLPARYVSGYVYAPHRGTASASHAWTDVFVSGRGWTSLDPTHDCPQSDHYVRLAGWMSNHLPWLAEYRWADTDGYMNYYIGRIKPLNWLCMAEQIPTQKLEHYR
jgi:transglutaminase-like putative cysteine protease